jgi:hypothetical protein
MSKQNPDTAADRVQRPFTGLRTPQGVPLAETPSGVPPTLPTAADALRSALLKAYEIFRARTGLRISHVRFEQSGVLNESGELVYVNEPEIHIETENL